MTAHDRRRHSPAHHTDPGHSAASPKTRRAATPIAPHQRRLARAIGGRANRVLEPHEEVLALSEAVVETGPVARTVLGAFWPSARRVALLFTPRRLIEISVGSGGTRGGGRIRTFPWDGIPSFRLVDDWLEVRTWNDDVLRWHLRDVPDPTVEGLLLKRVNLAVSTYVPSLSRTAPVLHCSSCGAPRPPAPAACRRCGADLRTPERAAQLAIAIPGAGHAYAQRPVAAAVRLLIEIAIFTSLAAVMLTTTDRWRVLGVAVLGVAVLGVMKFHAAWSSRLLIEGAGAIGPTANQRWRWAVPVGGLVSVATLLLPLLLVGALDTHVDWHLVFTDSSRSWTVTRPPFTPELRHIARLDEVWTHRGGQWVLVQSWPFAPFASSARATARVARDWGIHEPPFQLGSHRVLQAAGEARAPDGSRLDTFILILIDDVARDIHALTTEVGPSGGEAAADRLRRLVATSYWAPHDPMHTD
jgi:hypothetical protein